MRLRWSRRALTRLEEIHAHIVQDNSAAALHTTQQIVPRVGQIVKFPNSGRRVPGNTRDDVRELIEGSYRIIYRLGADRIEVLTVNHCAQRLPARPAQAVTRPSALQSRTAHRGLRTSGTRHARSATRTNALTHRGKTTTWRWNARRSIVFAK